MTRTVTLVLAAAVFAAPAAPAPPPGASLSFNGTTYYHRWSNEVQNEYTPEGEEDLSAWESMVTIVVHETVRDGEQLAELANRVLGNFQAAGNILRTDSKPRTEEREAEHFMAAVLGDPQFLEAAFARILLVEGRGVVIVYSHRAYGSAAGNEMSAWLEKNGERIEKALLAWKGLPSAAELAALQRRAEAIAGLKELGYPNPDDADAFVGAATQGYQDVVRLFLAAGMPVDQPNFAGRRAFLMALSGGHVDLAADLLEAGAEPNLADRNGSTPLMALSMDCDETTLFAAILEKGVDVNAQQLDGLTALQLATYAGCEEIIRMLREAGAVR